MFSVNSTLALFAQVAAVIVTALYARELATKNVGTRFVLASVIGSYAWLSTASAVFLAAADSSVLLAVVLAGNCTVAWILALLAGGSPFPGEHEQNLGTLRGGNAVDETWRRTFSKARGGKV